MKRRRASRWPLLLRPLLLWPVLTGMSPAGMSPAGVSPGECERLSRAHSTLLGGSFEVDRRFELSINGEPKRREHAKVTSTVGVLATEVLAEEVLSRGLVLDPGGGELALGIGFACARVEDLGEGRLRLVSEDGLERADFALDKERGALRPLGWRLETRERFLFKKLHIEGEAVYSLFRWLGPEAEPPVPR